MNFLSKFNSDQKKASFDKGVVHKLRLQDEVGSLGGPKMSTFCQRSYHRKCQWSWSKKPKHCQPSL
jgi:hypothetical protein